MKFFYWFLFFLPTVLLGQTFKINVTTEQGYDDYTLLNFDTLATDTFDFNYDGIKFLSQNGYPTIYTTDSNLQVRYSINSLKPITNKSKKIDFNVIPGMGSNINLEFFGFANLESYVLLWDKKLNVHQVINSDSTYQYNIDGTDTIDYRFRMTFYPKPIIFLDTLECHSLPVKLVLSLSDTTSPHLNFNIYNTSLTYSQNGHFGGGTFLFSSLIPSGNYYLKLGLIPPQNQTFLNSWVKQYYFVIDTIIPIEMSIDFSSQQITPNQMFSFVPTFNPSDMTAIVDMGDGSYNYVVNNENYQYSYSDTGTYTITFKVFDPISNCTEVKQYNVHVFYPIGVSYSTFTNGKLYYSNGNVIINPNININYVINIYDTSGRLVGNTTLDMIKNNNYMINVSNLSSGIYIIELIDKKRRFTKKILKIND